MKELLALIISLLISLFKPTPPLSVLIPFPTPTPTPAPPPIIENYQPPTLKPAPAYTILFVGDSMTAALGPNFDALRSLLDKSFPNKVFGLFNYGFGSTNILSVYDRLINDQNYLGQTLPAILSREFEVIILESMGHNPLSQFPLSEGLNQQTDALDKFVARLAFEKPNSLIVFLTTIAPSQSHYALKTTDLSPQIRNLWANERRNYIENHLNYALRHHIPVIDVYAKSLDAQGNTLLKYVNSSDYIHPSGEGIKLISQEIADFLNTVLPH